MEENVAKLMKVAWLTLPLGLLLTIAGCFFVFWWQDLCYSNPYGQAILINGNLLNHILYFHNTILMLLAFLLSLYELSSLRLLCSINILVVFM